MVARRIVLIILGILILLMGTVFTLQGEGMAGTGSIMDNNPTYIYVGGIVAVIGLLLIVAGVLSKPKSPTVSPSPGQPSRTA
jgi:cytochrome c biogenesis protein CcdA